MFVDYVYVYNSKLQCDIVDVIAQVPQSEYIKKVMNQMSNVSDLDHSFQYQSIIYQETKMSKYSCISDKLKKSSVYISQYELVWKINDIDILINETLENQVIVLGGDILNASMQYTCDNWYYNQNNIVK